MALTLRRRRIRPMPPQNFAPAIPAKSTESTGLPDDDYLVEGEERSARRSATLQVVQFLQLVLIVFLGVLSLAVFWIVGTLFNII